MSTPLWQQQPAETGEAYSAWRSYYNSEDRDIHQAWRYFHFTRDAQPHPDDPLFLAPPHWHAWKAAHNWDARVQAADAEQRQLDFEAAETGQGNAISWIRERQDDHRDRLAIYRNLRKGLVKLTESGELRDTTRRTVANIEGRKEEIEETIRAVEQLKYVERNGPLLFPADNSKPELPEGGGPLFVDLDTIADLAPKPAPPPRIRYRPKTYSRWNPDTGKEETWVA